MIPFSCVFFGRFWTGKISDLFWILERTELPFNYFLWLKIACYSCLTVILIILFRGWWKEYPLRGIMMAALHLSLWYVNLFHIFFSVNVHLHRWLVIKWTAINASLSVFYFFPSKVVMDMSFTFQAKDLNLADTSAKEVDFHGPFTSQAQKV